MSIRLCFMFLGLMTTLGYGELIHAQTPAKPAFQKASEVPIEVFFSREKYQYLQLSLDGSTLLAVVPINGRENLVLINLADKRPTVVTTSATEDVVRPRWIGNKYIFFVGADGKDVTGEIRTQGTYYYDLQEKKVYPLFSYVNKVKSELRFTDILGVEGGESPELYVMMKKRSRKYNDVYKVNLKTRASELVSVNSPGRTESWLLDSKKRIRLTKTEEREALGKPEITTYLHLAPGATTWQKMFEHSSYRNGVMYEPLGFLPDDKTLIVATNKDGRDKMALFEYDTHTMQFGALIHEDPIYDLNGRAKVSPIFGRAGTSNEGKLVGFEYEADVPKRVFLNAYRDPVLDDLEKALAGTFFDVSYAKNGEVALVSTESDTDAGRFYLFDVAKRRLELIAQSREWAKPELMSPREFVQFNARDGLPLYGYLTVPKDVPAKNLPLIVHVHGGPSVRGYQKAAWGRTPDAQFFASRGYAVLELEPRGSEGFGRKHFVSSWKQWGKTMQDDLNDGALYLVQRGIVDKSRMALFGGSYGGYATLQGMTRDPVFGVVEMPSLRSQT
jgi:dipeptidyl aminopeptidase/acylaminoacyl peptidase